MPQRFHTRLMQPADWDEVAQLIYNSLNVWYEKNRGFKLVTGSWETMRIFPEVYEALDPNCCVLVVETQSSRIAGSCFFHVRSKHVALGILNTHPDFFNCGVASMLQRYVMDVADRENKPLRLVSGATNVDSFSLYNRNGFVPTCFYQDMIVKVPADGFPVPLEDGIAVRNAVESDIPAMVALEEELTGVEREKDYRFFLKNEGGIWHTSVLLTSDNKLGGFIASVCHPGSNMLGPGVARCEEYASALLRFELNQHIGRSPVFLIPSRCKKLTADMYSIGAKNCELHISQVRGEEFPQTGIVFPTFMPETA